MIAVLGIDPGVNGGLAVVDPDGRPVHLCALKPEMTTKDLKIEMRAAFKVLHGYLSRACYMEKVGYIGRREDGSKDGGQGAFTFGRIAGLLEMGAEMMDLDVVLVSPMRWQGAMGCLSGGDKNVTKDKAKELWPDVKWTHVISDAALIAEFGRRRLSL